MQYFRKWKSEDYLKPFDTLDAALEDRDFTLTSDVFKGSIELIGAITTVMIPTRILDSDAKKKAPPFKSVDECDEDEDEGDEYP